jgi:hypothetical protein
MKLVLPQVIQVRLNFELAIRGGAVIGWPMISRWVKFGLKAAHKFIGCTTSLNTWNVVLVYIHQNWQSIKSSSRLTRLLCLLCLLQLYVWLGSGFLGNSLLFRWLIRVLLLCTSKVIIIPKISNISPKKT